MRRRMTLYSTTHPSSKENDAASPARCSLGDSPLVAKLRLATPERGQLHCPWRGRLRVGCPRPTRRDRPKAVTESGTTRRDRRRSPPVIPDSGAASRRSRWEASKSGVGRRPSVTTEKRCGTSTLPVAGASRPQDWVAGETPVISQGGPKFGLRTRNTRKRRRNTDSPPLFFRVLRIIRQDD